MISCAHCNKPIRKKEDLITAFYFMWVSPYHAACYARQLTTWNTAFLKNYPINSVSNTMLTIFMPIFFLIIMVCAALAIPVTDPVSGLIFLVWSVFVLIGAVLAPIAVRLYSYYTYELPLSNTPRHKRHK